MREVKAAEGKAHLVPAQDQKVAGGKEAVERFRSARCRWRRVEMSTEEILAGRREGLRW